MDLRSKGMGSWFNGFRLFAFPANKEHRQLWNSTVNRYRWCHELPGEAPLLALRLPWTEEGRGYNLRHILFTRRPTAVFPRWPDLYIHANSAETVALMVNIK